MKNKLLCLLISLCMLVWILPNLSVTVNAEIYFPVSTFDWNGHTYHIYDESLTWEEAKQYCENSGGHLVTINSKDENNAISQGIKNSAYSKSMYWIGGFKDGDWKWVTGEAMKYTNWNEGEPTNTQNCMAIYTSLAQKEISNKAVHGMWLDNPNNGIGNWSVAKTGFICEFGESGVIAPEDYKEYSLNFGYGDVDFFWISGSPSYYKKSSNYENEFDTIYVENTCSIGLMADESASNEMNIYYNVGGITPSNIYNRWKSLSNNRYEYLSFVQKGEPKKCVLESGEYLLDTFCGGDGITLKIVVGSLVAEKEVTAYLNGKQINFDVPPIIENGTTLVPVRAIFEAMGMAVDWDNETSSVIAEGNGNKLILPVGNNTATVNGKDYILNVPAKIVDGRTLVPVRFVAESVGGNVDWNQEEKRVDILYSPKLNIALTAGNTENCMQQGDFIFIKPYQYAAISAKTIAGKNVELNGYSWKTVGDGIYVNNGTLCANGSVSKNTLYLMDSQNNVVDKINVNVQDILFIAENLEVIDNFSKTMNINSNFSKRNMTVRFDMLYADESIAKTLVCETKNKDIEIEVGRPKLESKTSARYTYTVSLIVSLNKEEYANIPLDIFVNADNCYSNVLKYTVSFYDDWVKFMNDEMVNYRTPLEKTGGLVTGTLASLEETYKTSFVESFKVECYSVAGVAPKEVNEAANNYIAELYLNKMKRGEVKFKFLKPEKIVESVEDYVENIDESVIYNYNGKNYIFEFSGISAGAAMFGGMTIQPENGIQYIVPVVTDEMICMEISVYLNKMKYLYDEAIDECIDATIGDASKMLGVDKLKKLLKSWKDEKIGAFIDKALANANITGIKYEDIQENYDLFDAVNSCFEKCINAKKNASSKNVSSAIEALKKMKREYIELNL